MQISLTVNLGERSYPIYFGENLFSALLSHLEKLEKAGAKLAFITDANVAKALGSDLAPLFQKGPVLTLEAGEESKSLGNFGRALDFLAVNKIDRGGVLVAIGGGVIGDLAGFAAASYLRGIAFIQVPTTLLAMVDSSVGGKTGINLSAGKNLAGAFHQPAAVYISTGVLRTLPAREFAAGMAEVIKYGLLGDKSLFEQLEKSPLGVASRELPEIVHRCCAIKARIVEADERETAKEGGRALLNLGHTFGHAVEKVAGYGAYLHGEAVAIGLCAAARLSVKAGLLESGVIDRTAAVLAAHRLPVRLDPALPYAALRAAMGSDKKVRAGGLRFVLMRGIGDSLTASGLDEGQVENSFREVGAA